MKRALTVTFLGLMAGGMVLPAAGSAQAASGTVYVIPVRNVIGPTLVYVIRRGIREAEARQAEAIVFDMDTPGGRLDAAEEILRMLRGLAVPTYTLVNPEAISAGAIMAMATDHIYMVPGGRIGDAMPLMLSLFGEVQNVPDGIEEKMVSYVAAIIRSAAQENGHDPQLAEAMVRRDTEYKIGDEVICPKGQLLTLTSQDAERRVGPAKRPLLSEGTVKDLDGLLERVGKAGCRRIELTVSAAEELAHLIESVSILLLAGGLLALYIEFKTPGFGLPGVLGILLLAIWFWGHNIAGLAGMEEMILFGLGVVLLLLEIFLIPGFGIVGIAGITLIIVSLLMAMLTRYPGEPWVPSFPRLEIPLRNLGLALILSVLGAWIVGRFLPKTTAFGKLVLSASTNRQEGYAASEDASRLVGLRGVAETPLRPAGMAMFGDERLDVVARGDYIEAGAQIVIAETHGNRIIVEKA